MCTFQYVLSFDMITAFVVIRPVRTIEKMCAWLVMEISFIHSAVQSANQVLNLVR